MTIECTIESLGSSGEGVGSNEGLKIFVYGALPGERVRAEILLRKKNYATAKLVAILTPSPHRKTPPCPYFGKCGGCQLMHLDEEGQLKAKEQKVADALSRIGGLKDLPLLPCLPSPHPLGYRNKIQLPVVTTSKGIEMGLYQRNSHSVVPIEQCLIQSEQGESVMQTLRSLLNDFKPPHLRTILIKSALLAEQKETLVVFVTRAPASPQLKRLAHALLEKSPYVKSVYLNLNRRKDNVLLGETFERLAGSEYITEKLLGKDFQISPAAFFQVNPYQAEALYKTALEWAALTPHDHVIDAFCGVGVLALLAAESAQDVVGIEIVPAAIKDAQKNAALNGIQNARFICGKAENLMRLCDVLFLNPPRKGCDTELIKRILSHPPKKILYISCDPATLARDLALLKEGFQIKRIQPFDMFPQTCHVETIVELCHLDEL